MRNLSLQGIVFCAFLLMSLSADCHGLSTSGPQPYSVDTVLIPVSKAELGTFPYFQTLENFTATDSVNQESNRTYFYDGRKYLTIDGRVSSQNLNIKNSNEKIAGTFGCIDAFDKVIAHLGGLKIYTGKLPEEPLKKLSGSDLVELGSKQQVAPSAFYGVVEYVIKTAEKEVWLQLQPYSLDSKFYTLLVVEKANALISLNINQPNLVLKDLEKSKKSVLHLDFGVDSTNLLSESKASLLQVLGVYQTHPDWKLSLNVYSASFGNPDYSRGLTARRADAIKKDLTDLGVRPAAITTKGMGEDNPAQPNNTETGRNSNNRIEIILE